MARATTAKYEEMVLEVEFDPVGGAGVFTNICGLIDVSISRSAQVNSVEIPDCDDESLPNSIEKQVQSLEFTASGTGVWAMQSHKAMMDWFYSSSTLNVRLRNAKVEADGATGDPYVEAGPALLTELSNDRSKGNKVSASISLEFDGTPTVTNKA